MGVVDLGISTKMITLLCLLYALAVVPQGSGFNHGYGMGYGMSPFRVFRPWSFNYGFQPYGFHGGSYGGRPRPYGFMHSNNRRRYRRSLDSVDHPVSHVPDINVSGNVHPTLVEEYGLSHNSGFPSQLHRTGTSKVRSRGINVSGNLYPSTVEEYGFSHGFPRHHARAGRAHGHSVYSSGNVYPATIEEYDYSHHGLPSHHAGTSRAYGRGINVSGNLYPTTVEEYGYSRHYGFPRHGAGRVHGINIGGNVYPTTVEEYGYSSPAWLYDGHARLLHNSNRPRHSSRFQKFESLPRPSHFAY